MAPAFVKRVCLFKVPTLKWVPDFGVKTRLPPDSQLSITYKFSEGHNDNETIARVTVDKYLNNQILLQGNSEDILKNYL
ncbi:unnamed protein product [Arctia plantaginis]|uniref:Uncharacterized protein n=1 Tax=Arctia plantaginis TaxID=874455 RepID=A0A8S0ZU61_ARCPL|nr:unnamed protein product [Arctia plantaginis]